MYESVEETEKRLSRCVVMYNDEPIYVDGAKKTNEGKIGLKVRNLPTWRPRQVMVRLDDPMLNFNKFKLGYVNGAKISVLFERMPVRRYKQGLTYENCRCNVPVELDFYEDYDYDLPAFDNIIRTAGFHKMMKGNYPSYRQALDEMHKKDEVRDRAFHRLFSINKDKTGLLLLHYKGERVGMVSPDNGDMMLGPNFSYLTDTFKRHGVNIDE